jgi:hypothetical protein
MPWVETASASFDARHESRDGDDVAGLLELLEATRAHAGELLAVPERRIDVVVHGSEAALDAALPLTPVVRRLTAPAARRYVVGWFGRDELHVLAPRLLDRRASGAPGSREMLLLAPAALYVQLAVGDSSRRLPPPFRPWSMARYRRWAWLQAGAGALISGQVEHARPSIVRRLREGPPPRFPPAAADALLLGGTVLDLLAREEGMGAVARLLAAPLPRGGPRHALVEAFGGRPAAQTEGTWRAHLGRLAGRGAG